MGISKTLLLFHKLIQMTKIRCNGEQKCCLVWTLKHGLIYSSHKLTISLVLYPKETVFINFILKFCYNCHNLVWMASKCCPHLKPAYIYYCRYCHSDWIYWENVAGWVYTGSAEATYFDGQWNKERTKWHPFSRGVHS